MQISKDHFIFVGTFRGTVSPITSDYVSLPMTTWKYMTRCFTFCDFQYTYAAGVSCAYIPVYSSLGVCCIRQPLFLTLW